MHPDQGLLQCCNPPKEISTQPASLAMRLRGSGPSNFGKRCLLISALRRYNTDSTSQRLKKIVSLIFLEPESSNLFEFVAQVKHFRKCDIWIDWIQG